MLTTADSKKKTTDDSYDKSAEFEFEAVPAEAYLSSEGCEEYSGN